MRAYRLSMSALIEIRTADDGAILARRLDGKPLTPEDREEARRIAARVPVFNTENTPEPANDPILSVEQWYPEFHRFHIAVIAETPDFDFGWVRENRPEIYRAIKAKENEIDALGAAQLSHVMVLLREWR